VSLVTRVLRTRERMDELGVDVLLLSVGADLPYLTGYEAMPLERLTMLVLPKEGDARLVVPRLEAPRVTPQPDLFEIVPWDETDDPVALVARLAGTPGVAAIGDHTWARFVLDLQLALPAVNFVRASAVLAPIRMVKDDDEIEALQMAAAAVDAIAVEMRAQSFAGRTELDVHRELVDRMLALGHERSNFAIVAAGANAASPHHEPSAERHITEGELVLCDFGGTMRGYCSDITRMFAVGEQPSEVREAYAVLQAAQEAGVQAATVGTPCAEVDAAARKVIADAGYGEYFVHRVGHGIGTEAHEEPYMVASNDLPLVPGHAFSVEPGIYVPGRFGMRLEDIVVATERGPRRLNEAPRDLAVVG
jgi:Xaa-Pro aminopeptidase